MIDSFGGRQDNVVFMGRRSFRMELAGTPSGSELGIPRSASEIPTERIFASDRERAVRAAVSSSRPATGISNAASIALCSTTFVLGIALTLAFVRPIQPRPAMAVAPAAPAQVAPPPPPPEPPVVVELAPASAATFPPPRAPARRPLAKPPARAVRPRPPRDPASTAPAATPWVDPFAE